MKRTAQQNKAIHCYFRLLAAALNDAGYDMKRVLKQSVDIPWTEDSVKRHLWKPIQDAMIGKMSTTQLETFDVSEVYDCLNRHTASKLAVSVAFPEEDHK